MAAKKEKKDSKKELSYKPMTEDEIKKLAEDIYRGLVFTDRHIQNPDDIPRVFVPLVLIDGEQREELNANPPGLIYEYMDRAGPLAINGMPMFYSLRMLSQEDAKKVSEKYNKIVYAVTCV